MKIKITRADGTVIELEGDAAQLGAILPHILPFPFNLSVPLQPLQPAQPQWPPFLDPTIRFTTPGTGTGG